MIMQLLRGLFGKKEEPRRVRTYNPKIEESNVVKVGRHKYFTNMDIARDFVRNKYKNKNWSYEVIAEDLNSKGYRTITKKLFNKDSVSWYLLSEDEWMFQKELRKEYGKITKGVKK